ncbi:MAG: hypothetical protein FJ279_38040, partial [Planctomycetes bacterium]|nr:hypothetical protein [Planctomycetota bacterium]
MQLESRVERLRAALLLALLTLLVFAGSLKMGFVNWDDHVYVYENSLVLHPSWAGCWRLLTGFYEHFYIPLVFLSYCADSILWQGKTWGYHLTNVLLHGASGV